MAKKAASKKSSSPAASVQQTHPLSESSRNHPGFQKLSGALREIAHLGSAAGLLSWDQETYMPDAAGPARGEQLALLASLAHERKTSPRLAEMLSACERDRSLAADPAMAACLRELRRDFDRDAKLPADLVADLAKTASEAQLAWRDARAKNDFAGFLPMLTRMIELTRRKAQCLASGPGHAPKELYDALLDEYEPGATASHIEQVFTPLRTELTTLIASVKEASGTSKTGRSRSVKEAVDTRCIREEVGERDQHAFGQSVLRAMGFDFGAGRLDTTTHPFCSGFAPGDTRLTTRYRESRFTDALYGTMHEGGHGLYEQGLPKTLPLLAGTPLAEAVSLGIHESQSRMWENFVGRSRSFWKWALPTIQKRWGKRFKRYDVDDFTRATNTITPSLIRVEADEGTYNMHVMIRFEIERALFSGALAPKDLPAAWNAKYKEYLGLTVPDDARGCMQDVHWSCGLYGYFPTYTLGNLYAAQLWECILEVMPDTPKQISKGSMLDLREWLRTTIHQHGRQFGASQLCLRATGKPLDSGPLLRHLRAKAADVYGVKH